jgi:hypothetical protein
VVYSCPWRTFSQSTCRRLYRPNIAHKSVSWHCTFPSSLFSSISPGEGGEVPTPIARLGHSPSRGKRLHHIYPRYPFPTNLSTGYIFSYRLVRVSEGRPSTCDCAPGPNNALSIRGGHFHWGHNFASSSRHLIVNAMADKCHTVRTGLGFTSDPESWITKQDARRGCAVHRPRKSNPAALKSRNWPDGSLSRRSLYYTIKVGGGELEGLQLSDFA